DSNSTHRLRIRSTIMNVEHIFEGINPTTRKTAYYVYGRIGVAIGAIQVGYSAAEVGQPTWLTVALTLLSVIGAAFGFTDGQNTPKQLIEIEQDATDDDLDFDAVDAELDELNGETEDYTPGAHAAGLVDRSEEHTSELQSRFDLVCRLLLEKKKEASATA